MMPLLLDLLQVFAFEEGGKLRFHVIRCLFTYQLLLVITKELAHGRVQGKEPSLEVLGVNHIADGVKKVPKTLF